MGASAAGAILGGLASVAATKVIAISLGPSAVASLQTLQQVRQAAVIAATANGQTALVQGASAREGSSRASYVRTCAAIFAAAGLSVTGLLLLAPAALLQRTGLAALSGAPAGWLASAVLLTALYVFCAALLNVAGKIEALAMLQTSGPMGMAVLAIPFVMLAKAGQGQHTPELVAASAGVAALAAIVTLRRCRVPLGGWFRHAESWFHPGEARHFFSISTAMLVTGFVASTANVLVRGNIVRTQGLAHAGLFDAAWSISMNQVTLALASVQTYYLPALSRAKTSNARAGEISRVLIAATLVAAPVIAGVALLKPVVLHVLYSAAFGEAHRYLRWTLIGDYLKVSSWILSVPMLAAADMRIFLASDLVSSLIFVTSARVLLHWCEPAESAAIAFLLMYVTHLAICSVYVYARQGIRFSFRTLAIWLAGLALVLTSSWAAWDGGVL
jgi:hypothetical protein